MSAVIGGAPPRNDTGRALAGDPAPTIAHATNSEVTSPDCQVASLGSVELLPARTQRQVAACAALGLDFWGLHPVSGHVWAASEDRTFHIVRIRYTGGTAQHVCSCFPDHPCNNSPAIVAYPVTA